VSTSLAHDVRCLQREALRAISDALVAIESGQEQYLFSLAERRAYMQVVLTQYHAFLHQRLFDPAIAGADDTRAAAARRLKASCIVAAAAHHAHVRDWPGPRIAAEWNAYRATARLAGSQLRRRMLDENEQLAGLIG